MKTDNFLQLTQILKVMTHAVGEKIIAGCLIYGNIL